MGCRGSICGDTRRELELAGLGGIIFVALFDLRFVCWDGEFIGSGCGITDDAGTIGEASVCTVEVASFCDVPLMCVVIFDLSTNSCRFCSDGILMVFFRFARGGHSCCVSRENGLLQIFSSPFSFRCVSASRYSKPFCR